MREAKIEIIMVPRWPVQKSKTLSQKYLEEKWAAGITQAVECLPCKFEALSSNPSTKRKR
jgi:hypothetical protein